MKPLLAESIEGNPLAKDVRTGLTAQQKTLPPKYFYDELGSQLFEAICALPEYYPTRSEAEILQKHAGEIIELLRNQQSIVELGSGSSIKTRYLLEALLNRQESLLYQPIDISESILLQSSRHLSLDYPRLQIQGQVGDYTVGLGKVERDQDGGLLVLFLGSNLGNYNPQEARQLLASVRKALRPGDSLLLGVDLKKSSAILEAAYNDALGVTAAFNLNLLVRINRELGADFNLKKFSHRAHYNSEGGCIEMHLVSTEAQKVYLRALDLAVEFQPGETIHTENSWKFDEEQLENLANETGFEVVQTWKDQHGFFSCNLWQATSR